MVMQRAATLLPSKGASSAEECGGKPGCAFPSGVFGVGIRPGK